jgi:hypothetical protein
MKNVTTFVSIIDRHCHVILAVTEDQDIMVCVREVFLRQDLHWTVTQQKRTLAYLGTPHSSMALQVPRREASPQTMLRCLPANGSISR